MQDSRDIRELLLTLDRDKNELINMKLDEGVASFVAEWFLFSENQIKKEEQKYIWSLMHGWKLSDFVEHNNIERESSNESVQISKNTSLIPLQYQKIQHSKVCLNFLASNEAVIKQNSTFFWINPTQLNKDTISLSKQFEYFLVVLTVSDFQHMFSLFDLMRLSNQFKVITVEPIYTKIKMLLAFLKKTNAKRYGDLVLGRYYFLKANEYFQYAGFLWHPVNSCWYEPSYDLLITPNDDKNTHFLVQSPKVIQTKYIYYGWKKGFISEQNYQKYTASNSEGIKTAKTDQFYEITKILIRNPKQYEYLHFKKKEFIKDIDLQDQEEVWNCLEDVSYTAGQIVVKKGTIFDHLYLLFDGEFEVEVNGKKENPANKTFLYGLDDFKKDLSHSSYNLRCIESGTVKRMTRWDFGCILYNYLV